MSSVFQPLAAVRYSDGWCCCGGMGRSRHAASRMGAAVRVDTSRFRANNFLNLPAMEASTIQYTSLSGAQVGRDYCVCRHAVYKRVEPLSCGVALDRSRPFCFFPSHFGRRHQVTRNSSCANSLPPPASLNIPVAVLRPSHGVIAGCCCELRSAIPRFCVRQWWGWIGARHSESAAGVQVVEETKESSKGAPFVCARIRHDVDIAMF